MLNAWHELFTNFFGHPKNHQKIDPSKNLFGRIFWCLFVFYFLFIPILGSPGGPQGVIFEYFFARLFLTGILSIFSKKKQEIEKVKKFIWICKLRCFVKVAMLKKTREDQQKNNRTNVVFLAQKSRKNR